MILILIDQDRYRSKYLYDQLKENYSRGRVHHLASIDKVKETSTMLKWSKNYGLAEEINKLWRRYNVSMADDIIDYLDGYYHEEKDIVLINIDGEDNVKLFMERCPYKVSTEFIGKAPKSYVDQVYDQIIKNRG